MAAAGEYFRFCAAQFRSSERVRLMTLAQVGLYTELLCQQWIEGSIPADMARAAALIGREPDEVRALFTGPLSEAFEPVAGAPDRLENRRLAQDRKRATKYRAKRVKAGRKGGRETQRRRRSKGTDEGQAHAQAHAQAVLGISIPPTGVYSGDAAPLGAGVAPTPEQLRRAVEFLDSKEILRVRAAEQSLAQWGVSPDEARRRVAG